MNVRSADLGVQLSLGSSAEGVREWSISQSGHINSIMIIYELSSIYLCDCTLFWRAELSVPIFVYDSRAMHHKMLCTTAMPNMHVNSSPRHL
jgi:hypothetical protein